MKLGILHCAETEIVRQYQISYQIDLITNLCYELGKLATLMLNVSTLEFCKNLFSQQNSEITIIRSIAWRTQNQFYPFST